MYPWLCGPLAAFVFLPFFSLQLSSEPLTPLPESAPVTAQAQAASADSGGFVSGRAPFVVQFGDQRVPYRVMGVFTLPGEVVPIDLGSNGRGGRVAATAGSLVRIDERRWSWTAPAAPGETRLRVIAAGGTEATVLHAFVMVPYAEMKHGLLRGYRIGGYPAPRPDQAEERPRGFVTITDETAALELSPHFRLGQFACRSGEGLPKYAVIQPRLLLRLEGLLELANLSGIRAGTFELLSAYRTPLYNREIGNVTTFTRHQYGDAADIYVDESPRDGRMDDLNHDGRFDAADARVLERLAAATEDVSTNGGTEGGLAAYRATGGHGAFVHVDTRGYRVRW